MATTSPDNISYPANTDAQKTVEQRIKDTATSVQTAFNLRPLSPNYIINGAFDIWQRGTSFSASGYTADRWTGDFVTGAGTVSQQTFTPGAAPVSGYEGTYFLRRSVTTGSQYSSLIHRIEDVRTLAGQTVTLSFWAKGTNPTGNFLVNLIQSFGTGGSSQVDNTPQALVLTSSWARYAFTFTLGSVAGKTIGAASYIWLSIYQAAANTSVSTLDIWGVQLEAGAVATPFRRNSPSLQAELAACQRYYVREYLYGAGAVGGGGTVPIVAKQFKVPMRATPSYSWISGGVAMDGTADVNITGAYGTPFRSESADGMELLFSSSALGSGRGVTVRGALVQFSAEL